jgi:DNA-binding NtrC family response regulator
MPPNYGDHVLVATPSTVVRQRVLESLDPRTYRVEHATGGAEALLHLEKGSWHRLFLDRRLPDLDAEELGETVRQRYPSIEVVWVDNENNTLVEFALPARPPQPLSVPSVSVAGNNSVGNDPSQDDPSDNDLSQNDPSPNDLGRTDSRGADSNSNEKIGCGEGLLYEEQAQCSSLDDVAREVALPGMIGRSALMQAVYRQVQLVAPRDTTVLITGPTGSGKELVARALHDLSPRAARNFAVVNCAAIPETLLEAELFGYSRGAFTGALQAYAGRIQAAHLGTLFLDEIGDMPLSLQPKLLRFLEQRELQRLGSSQLVHVDVRVVSATNVDLLTLVREGKFREDLYYRLSAFPLAIPPLRERPADIAELAEHSLEKFSGGAPTPILSNEALAFLRAESWPGNVRELQNVIERALVLASGQTVIRPAHLMLPGAENRSAPSCAQKLDDRTPSSVRAINVF